jgi:hypothetical protein
MDDATARSTAPLDPEIHRELDRLRTVDWTERPPTVESAIGTLRCNYDETLGTHGWICLNGMLNPLEDAEPEPAGTPQTPPGHQVRIWIPQPRRR